MYSPSGVHTGQSCAPGRKLSRDAVSRSRSFTQRFDPLSFSIENANRLPSGEKRGVTHRPGGACSGWAVLPPLSTQEIGHTALVAFPRGRRRFRHART